VSDSGDDALLLGERDRRLGFSGSYVSSSPESSNTTRSDGLEGREAEPVRWLRLMRVAVWGWDDFLGFLVKDLTDGLLEAEGDREVDLAEESEVSPSLARCACVCLLWCKARRRVSSLNMT
jgi:hypothetical protein